MNRSIDNILNDLADLRERLWDSDAGMSDFNFHIASDDVYSIMHQLHDVQDAIRKLVAPLQDAP